MQAFGVGPSWDEQPATGGAIRADLRGALTALAERLARRRTGLLLTVDELQGLQMPDAREMAVTVQHVTRREQLPVAFVGGALPEIEETVLNDRGMTFFQRCARAPLLPLGPDDAELAFLRPIVDAGKSIGKEARQIMVEASRGHPYTIQLLGYHSWRAAFEADRAPRIEAEHARAAVREAEWVELEQIVKPIWTGLSEVDRAFLVAMAHDADSSAIGDIAQRLGRSANYAQHYRRRLIDAGMIEAAGRGRVRFAHHATREWLSTLGFQVGGIT